MSEHRLGLHDGVVQRRVEWSVWQSAAVEHLVGMCERILNGKLVAARGKICAMATRVMVARKRLVVRERVLLLRVHVWIERSRMRVRGRGIVLVHVVVLHLVGPKILSSVVAMLGSILILRYHVVAVLTMVDPIMGRPAAGIRT